MNKIESLGTKAILLGILLVCNTCGAVEVTKQGTPSFHEILGVTTDGKGNIYVADTGNHLIRKITRAGVITTLAGTMGAGIAYADGTGTTAKFRWPTGIAIDSAGNVYVADSITIRKITPTGVVTTLAGAAGVAGHADGTGAAASFRNLGGVATDSAGNIYVADTGNNTIRKITPSGIVTTLAGTAGISGKDDGMGAAARFLFPSGVAIDRYSNVYVADSGNGSIRKITPAGVVTTLSYGFNSPSGVATDSAGNVYVADTKSHTIRKITPAGVVTTLAGAENDAGYIDGTGAAARFFLPKGLATDSAGNVYVADSCNFAVRKITPDGVVSTLAGGNAGNCDIETGE